MLYVVINALDSIHKSYPFMFGLNEALIKVDLASTLLRVVEIPSWHEHVIYYVIWPVRPLVILIRKATSDCVSRRNYNQIYYFIWGVIITVISTCVPLGFTAFEDS